MMTAQLPTPDGRTRSASRTTRTAGVIADLIGVTEKTAAEYCRDARRGLTPDRQTPGSTLRAPRCSRFGWRFE